MRAALYVALLIAGLFGSAGIAVAQEPTPDQQSAIRSNCRSDFMANCSGVPRGGKEAMQCLKDNVAKLSSGCQQAVRAVMPAPAPKPSAPVTATPAAPAAPPPAAMPAAPVAATPAAPAAPAAPATSTATQAAAKPAAPVALTPPAAAAKPAAVKPAAPAAPAKSAAKPPASAPVPAVAAPALIVVALQARKGGWGQPLGLNEDPSNFSVACRQLGPITTDLSTLPEKEEAFSEKTSIFFKATRIYRVPDVKRNAIIYLAVSSKIIEGSPSNAISVVPIMPWASK
jgi:hypothetical protein